VFLQRSAELVIGSYVQYLFKLRGVASYRLVQPRAAAYPHEHEPAALPGSGSHKSSSVTLTCGRSSGLIVPSMTLSRFAGDRVRHGHAHEVLRRAVALPLGVLNSYDEKPAFDASESADVPAAPSSRLP